MRCAIAMYRIQRDKPEKGVCTNEFTPPPRNEESLELLKPQAHQVTSVGRDSQIWPFYILHCHPTFLPLLSPSSVSGGRGRGGGGEQISCSLRLNQNLQPSHPPLPFSHCQLFRSIKCAAEIVSGLWADEFHADNINASHKIYPGHIFGCSRIKKMTSFPRILDKPGTYGCWSSENERRQPSDVSWYRFTEETAGLTKS